MRPLKVVVDGGNGMAGPMVGPILDRLGLDLVKTYWTPDGNFPDHEPNPLLEENRRFIVQRVHESGADLGIAWDGDADRCFFIDDSGTFVDGDFLTALLAQSLLRTHPGAAILYDVRASRAVPDTVEQSGGTAYVNRVGHAFFKTRMRAEGSLFGGEVSGHYYFHDFYNADSGTIPALLILELLGRTGSKLSELLAPLRSRYFISGRAQLDRRRRGGQDGAHRGALCRRPDLAPRRRLDRLRRLALQRAPVEHRAAAATVPGVTRLAGGHGAPPRRGPGPHPLVTGHEETERSDAALARAAEAGIHRLAIPTPFQVGRVNAYLIEDDPLTLVDSGPNSGKALDELEQALAAHGHAIEDLELLVITHQHIDHFGLAGILARRSGAEVAALDLLAPLLERYGEQAELDDRFAERMMLRHGIPADMTTALRSVSASFRGWGGKVQVTRPLRDGEDLVLRDRTLRALHRPGHSPSDTVFCDEARSMLIAGDHLIAHISSNPLLARPLDAAPDAEVERPQALVTYLASMARTREMDLDIVLSGHGAAITDHVALIDERFRQHRRRAEKIYRLIAEQPRSAHEIALALWGNIAVTQAYLTLSEVLGHIDLLLNDGRVREIEGPDETVRFTVSA